MNRNDLGCQPDGAAFWSASCLIVSHYTVMHCPERACHARMAVQLLARLSMQPVRAPDAGTSQHARGAAAAADALRSFRERPAAHQDFQALKARGYKPAWYPDAVHTDTQAALWLNADGSLARWQQVRVSTAEFIGGSSIC